MFNVETPLFQRHNLTSCSPVKAPQATLDSEFLETSKEELKKIIRGESCKILTAELAFWVKIENKLVIGK